MNYKEKRQIVFEVYFLPFLRTMTNCHFSLMTQEQASAGEISFACVCASNVNRSMEGHRILQKNGFIVSSYGTNDVVRMPGAISPHSYDFGSTYDEILDQLKKEQNSFYEENGIISMLEKDAETKPKPERFASTFNPASRKYFEVIFTYQDTVLNKVLTEFYENGNQKMKICHVVNIETPDSRADAIKAADHTLELAQLFASAKDLTEQMEDLIESFNKTHNNIISFHIVTY